MPIIRSSDHLVLVPYQLLIDNRLDFGSRVLFGVIFHKSLESCCNKYLSELLQVSVRTIQNWLKQLENHGYIKINIFKEGFETVREIQQILEVV